MTYRIHNDDDTDYCDYTADTIEEIKELCTDRILSKGWSNGWSEKIDCYDTFGNFNTRHKPNAKARSIVAMLFWEWRKSEARIYATNIKWNTGRAFQSQILFEKAYKMLKENK